MTVNVMVTTETCYTVDIHDISEKDGDKLFEELSCQPCMDDMTDVKSFFDEKGVGYEVLEDNQDSRVETWR